MIIIAGFRRVRKWFIGNAHDYRSLQHRIAVFTSPLALVYIYIEHRDTIVDSLCIPFLGMGGCRQEAKGSCQTAQ